MRFMSALSLDSSTKMIDLLLEILFWITTSSTAIVFLMTLRIWRVKDENAANTPIGSELIAGSGLRINEEHLHTISGGKSSKRFHQDRPATPGQSGKLR